MLDSEIIALYNQRSEDAIKETDAKYGTYCFAVANNILCSREDSEECLNDAYLSVWNSIPPQNPKSLKLFLAKIVRNLSFNRYKEQRRQKRGGGEIVVVLDELREVADSESDFDKDAFANCMNAFLHELPARERNIFIRRYFYAEGIESIAKRYGTSTANAYAILSRTRKKLKTYLQKEGFYL